MSIIKVKDPAPVTANQVKKEASRRLNETDWAVTRKAETGEEIPADIASKRMAIREASDTLEAMGNEIPADYTDDKYWP